MKIDANTRYKIEAREKDYSTLSYENGNHTLKVPNALMPFWAKNGESLYYKDGQFNREV